MGELLTRRKILKTGAGIIGVMATSPLEVLAEERRVVRHISIDLSNGKELTSVKVPVYSPEIVPKGYCSRYVRLADKDLFNVSVPACDAWNMRYDMLLAEEFSDDWEKDIAVTVERNEIKPGMLTGIFYPKSRHLEKKDEKGSKVKYTHIALFIGIDKNGASVFAEKFGKRTQLTLPKDFASRGMRIIEILNPIKE